MPRGRDSRCGGTICHGCMAKTFDEIGEELNRWLREQKMFFVATAPRADEGLVNCSPKGLDTFRILDPRTIAYLDLTGSGVETIAHLKENGRIVIMFCAFAGRPRIVRFHGHGEVIEPGDEAFPALIQHFDTLPGVRSIIRIRAARISDSCGYSVPRFDYVGDREVLTKWADEKGPAGVENYQRKKNRRSLDGLPGVSGRK